VGMYRGLRQIAARIGWKSPMTPLRHHEKYDDPKLAFPMTMLPTGVGWGFVWITSDAQIELWLHRHSELSANERIARLKWPRKRKVGQMGGTPELAHSRGDMRPPHDEAQGTNQQPQLCDRCKAEITRPDSGR